MALITALASIDSAKAGVAVDPNFHASFFATPDYSARVVLLPSGKFVLFFNTDTLTDQPIGPITRYNSDGTLDPSFSLSSDYSSVEAAIGLADGHVIVAASQPVYGVYQVADKILRLNSDGTIDPTFNPAAAVVNSAAPGAFDQPGTSIVRTMAIQPSDGKILVAGFFRDFGNTTHPGIIRLNTDGTLDPNFAAITLQFPPFVGLGLWAKPVVQTDGKIIIAGDFSGVNNVAFPGVARLNSDGKLDPAFNPSGFTRRTNSQPIRGVVVQQIDGKVVVGGRFTVGTSVVPLVRMNPDGSFDPTYFLQTNFFDTNLFPNHSGQIRDLVAQADGKPVGVTGSVVRFNTDGSIDSSFNQIPLVDDTPGQFPQAYTVNIQTDGRILIGGTFDYVGNPIGPNFPRWGVARFNVDGSLDSSLTTSHKVGQKVAPSHFARQLDGSTLIAFNQRGFSTLLPPISHAFGRLFSNGTLDATFDPLASLPGGPVTGRGFTNVPSGNIFGFGTDDATGSSSYGILLPNGTVADPNYNNDPSVSFDSAIAQPDGAVLIASSDPQNVVNGRQLLRLNTDGSVDSTFSLDPQITAEMVQRDFSTNAIQIVGGGMKVLSVGQNNGRATITYLGADGTYHLRKLQSDGTIDTTVQPGSAPASSTTTTTSINLVTDPVTNQQAFVTLLIDTGAVPAFSDVQKRLGNGQIIVSGSFLSYGASTAKGLVRLNSDGSVDPTFAIGPGAQWTQTTETATFHPAVDNVELQGDGKLLITGTFEAFNGVPAPGIASLNPDGSIDNSFVAPVTRQKYSSSGAILALQADGSFLLSGPYTSTTTTVVPSFIHLLGPPVITSPLTAKGTVGQQFTYQFEASGATSLAVTNLPAGLTFNTKLAAITGAPTAPGTFPVGLSAANAAGTTSATLTITVQPAPSSGPVITSSTSATGRVGRPFSFQVTTTGGSPSTRVSATALPQGLSIDAVTGLISGTPAAEGSMAVTLTVTDGILTSTSILQLTFTADPAIPVIISSNTASVTQGQSFSYAISAPANSNPSDVTTYTLIGTLPAGLFFDSKTGIISGTFTGSLERVGLSPNRIDLSGGIVTNVQLFATNSHGTSTLPLLFTLAPTGAVNISTRLAVGNSDNVLIAGFIITGNAPKKVIIRAIAPSLKANGVPLPGALQDPTLELHDGGSTLGANDNWRDEQANEIIDSTVPPTDDRESAIVATLAPGNYTAIVAGKDNTTGIAVVELYDLGTSGLDNTSKAQLAQISTRGKVLTDDNVMIGGFIISGSATKVIVRAIGPSLNGIVPGALQDTVLELHDSSGSLINSNDDWRTTQEQQIIDTTVPPKDNRESAIVATLNPGAYTAIVRGKGNTTGVALVEVYGLQ